MLATYISYAEDELQLKAVVIEHERHQAYIPNDNSIIYCGQDGFRQVVCKPPIVAKERKKKSKLKGEEKERDLKQEKIDMAKQLKMAKSKPTFELQPEYIDLIFEMEQKEMELLNEKIDRDHFEVRPADLQRKIPFRSIRQDVPKINKEVQLWFTRSDINQLSLARAKRGYGFATVPG
jgi:hypothetical protein